MLEWLKNLFDKRQAMHDRRTAAVRRQHARQSIDIAKKSDVACPFCASAGCRARYDIVANSFSTTVCHRNGSVETLKRRLHDPEAYRYAVE